MDVVLSTNPIPATSALHRITSAVVSDVARRMGRPSRWNGQIYVLRRPRSASAAALDDGRLAVNRGDVLRPFEEALRARTRGQALSGGLARRLRDAMDSLIHEGCHLAAPMVPHGGGGVEPKSTLHIGLAPPGRADPVERPMSQADRAAAGALHEGLVRVWTERNLDEIVGHVGLDAVFPELTSVSRGANGPRPALLAIGAQAVVSELSLVTGRKATGVLQQLVASPYGHGWTEAADMVVQAALPNLPSRNTDEVRARLAEVGRAAYGGVVTDYLSTDRVADVAWQVATKARQAVRAALTSAEAELHASTGEGRPQLTALPGGRTEAVDVDAGETTDSSARAAAVARVALSGHLPLVAGAEMIATDPDAPTPAPVTRVAPVAPVASARPVRDTPAPDR